MGRSLGDYSRRLGGFCSALIPQEGPTAALAKSKLQPAPGTRWLQVWHEGSNAIPSRPSNKTSGDVTSTPPAEGFRFAAESDKWHTPVQVAMTAAAGTYQRPCVAARPIELCLHDADSLEQNEPQNTGQTAGGEHVRNVPPNRRAAISCQRWKIAGALGHPRAPLRHVFSVR
jgi:hypothetical protein